jgi:hypothetical protein
VAAGEAFTAAQLERLDRSRRLAEASTGIRFSVRVGAVSADVESEAERMLAGLVDGSDEPAVLILVSPGQRFVRVVTTPAARRRVGDNAANLAVLAMTSSFGVGDLVGGIVNGLRQLSDVAGPAAAPRQAATAGADGSPPAVGTAGGSRADTAASATR